MHNFQTIFATAVLAFSLHAAANPQTGCDYPLLIAADDFESLAFCEGTTERVGQGYMLAVHGALAEIPRLKPELAKLRAEPKAWVSALAAPSPMSCKSLPPPPPPMGVELTDEEVAVAEQALLKAGLLPCAKNMTQFCQERKAMLMPESRDLRIFLHNVYTSSMSLSLRLSIREALGERPDAPDTPAFRKLLADTATGKTSKQKPLPGYPGAGLIAPQCYNYKPLF